ncbi:MAG: biopolymer transporter ExbD [Pirellulaceae bacterium]|nr:biopolymer transporter ExbD [Pirellulaceae bacterium]
MSKPIPVDIESDQIELVRKKHREDAEMDITPMIDITFLLLIFFLVATKMETQAQVQLPLAEHGKAASEKNSIILAITSENGQTKVLPHPPTEVFPVEDILAQEAAIADYVAQQMNRTPRPKFLMLKVDKDVESGEVDRVSRVATQEESLPLQLAVKEERQQ